jgi:hypothetical protein
MLPRVDDSLSPNQSVSRVCQATAKCEIDRILRKSDCFAGMLVDGSVYNCMRLDVGQVKISFMWFMWFDTCQQHQENEVQQENEDLHRS